MKETICTIPINDIFMPKCGCPFCRMESMLEEQYVKFITGDAMMEPNIRIETNKKGFCHRHFSQMFEKGQKLLTVISMGLSILTVLFLAMTRDVYAITVAFLLLIIKGILLLKHIKASN